MSTFRWTFVAAAIAATCLASRPASAQYAYYRSGSGMTEISTGTPAYPAGTAVPLYAGGAAMSAAPATPAAPAAPMTGVTGSYCGSETGGGCDSGCGLGGILGCGCDPAWRAWGDFLYLRARNEDVEYAVPLDATNSVQVGQTATMNPEFSSGFRVGFELPWTRRARSPRSTRTIATKTPTALPPTRRSRWRRWSLPRR